MAETFSNSKTQSLRCVYNKGYILPFISFGATTPGGLGPPHSRGSCIKHKDTSQSIRFLWTSDQLVAETST
jgi:hypothetical protein